MAGNARWWLVGALASAGASATACGSQPTTVVVVTTTNVLTGTSTSGANSNSSSTSSSTTTDTASTSSIPEAGTGMCWYGDAGYSQGDMWEAAPCPGYPPQTCTCQLSPTYLPQIMCNGLAIRCGD